ncbi:MAG: response regulator [Alphaproteobacteria bacterium]
MSGTALIVDDSLTVRMNLVELLSDAGIQCVACSTLAEARRAVAEFSFALIILDILLPDGDGIELLREIRANPLTSKTNVMLLSTEAEIRDRVRGLSTGADEYVGKPYDPSYLMARARQLVRQATAEGRETRETILLIDDSVTFREALKSALEQASYHVVVAGTGEEGLKLAADITPSAIVVDGELPGIDGPTVIRRIRLDAALREMPCFLLTGSEDREAEVRALEAGADAFARKEDNPSVIIARIAAMLRASREQSMRADTRSLQGPKKVLAVDDSETYLQTLAEALRTNGYEVILARSGEQALELLTVETVDCILLDLLMPGIGGRETCHRIKNAPAIRDIPVIMLTAVEDREAMISGLGAGADDYISKSSDLEVVRARVLAQIRRKRFEDEHRISREQQRVALQIQLERLNLLSEITRAIAARHDLTSIYQVALGNLEEQLPVDFAGVFVLDEASNVFSVIVGPRSREITINFALPGRASLFFAKEDVERAVGTRQIYEPDIQEIESTLSQLLAKNGLRSLVITPLLSSGTVFAFLVAARAAIDAFSGMDCDFLQQLSEHISLAVIQAKLHRNLQDAYDDLRQSQHAVMQQERLRVIGQMASGIAHDINNAMTPLAVMTQRLLESQHDLRPELTKYLNVAKLVTDDVSATVARMREFYREREPQVAFVPVSLNTLIDQVVELTRARWSDMAQRAGIVIEVKRELTPDLPAIMGIESEIREVLTNLIFNAVDAMPRGGTLTLRTRCTELKDPGPGERVMLEVADTGIGMDETTRRRCTEPFFTTKGERGTGLGLAMVHGVAKRHDANLEIDSAQGKGTTFRLDFAVAGTQEEGANSASALETNTAPPMNVLLVDDDPIILEVMQSTLEADGHKVVAANGGREGVTAFADALDRHEPINVVITDLGMPNMNGLEVAKAVKTLRSGTPIILLSGWGRKMDAEHDSLGQVDFTLAKPPKLPDLRAAMVACSKLQGRLR